MMRWMATLALAIRFIGQESSDIATIPLFPHPDRYTWPPDSFNVSPFYSAETPDAITDHPYRSDRSTMEGSNCLQCFIAGSTIDLPPWDTSPNALRGGF